VSSLLSANAIKQREKGKRWSRKRRVAKRYDVTTRTVDRMARDGRLPPPEYPLGPNLPLWNDAKLDAHDRRTNKQT
jgi:hypothetical protein